MADPRLDRRSVLRTAALLGLGIPAATALLQACGKPELTASDLRLASPDDPVRWTIQEDNQPIADGLSPEAGPLILYNYADYVAPGVVKSFEKEYGVEVKISTFNDTDEAVQKIRTGSVPFDIYFPSYDQISRLVAAEMVQPLNHTYLSNIENVWPTFKNPWYDQGWQFTVPYTVYSTGIGWNTDLVQDVDAARQPVRRPVGPAVLRDDGDHRRLAHRDGDGRPACRHHRRQHRQTRRTSARSATA